MELFMKENAVFIFIISVVLEIFLLFAKLIIAYWVASVLLEIKSGIDKLNGGG